MKITSGAQDFPYGLRGLVFDVDGVLFDSRNSNIEYYNLIRRAVQLPPLSPEEEDFCHMATVEEIFTLIIPDHLRNKAAEAARQINYHEQILPLLSPEPGLPETLHWLRQWKVRMAIFTNRTNSVEKLLRWFGLEEFFFPLKTAGNCRPKPNPQGLNEIVAEWGTSANQIAFLGDSKVDELAAEAAGVPFLAFRNESLQAKLHFTDFFTLISRLTPFVEHAPQASAPSIKRKTLK